MMFGRVWVSQLNSRLDDSFALTSDHSIVGQACGKTGRVVAINAKISVSAQSAGATLNLAMIPTGYRSPIEASVLVMDDYAQEILKAWITAGGAIRAVTKTAFTGDRYFRVMASYYTAE